MAYSLKYLVALTLCLKLYGLGEHPAVVAGEASFENPDPKTQEIKVSDKTVINFKKFNLAADEKTRFIQPSERARVLCRVTGGEPSFIEGRLEANGRLFFVNPSSIVFRETAQVKASSLVVSTLDIRDSDFLAGKGRFFLNSEAKESAIIQQGMVSAGQVILMAPQVVNTGTISATLSLLGGDIIALDFEKDGLISFAIEAPLKSGFIEAGGKIASEGDVYIGLKVASHLIRSTLNTNGLLESVKVQKENGVVRLVASEVAASTVKVEAPILATKASFKAKTKIELAGEQRVDYLGGKFEGPKCDVVLKSAQGTVAIEGPMEVGPIKSLCIAGQVIDQNSSITTKTSTTYDAPTIYLGGNLTITNKKAATFTGSVVVDSPVKITGGYSSGSSITFLGNVSGPSKLEIVNNQGSVDFKEPIGLSQPLAELKISKVKNLTLPRIGSETQVGVGLLQIEESELNLPHNSLIFAHHQIWRGTTTTAKQGAAYRTDTGPLSFSAACKIEAQGALTFEGKEIELPEILGGNSVMADAQSSKVTTQKMFVSQLDVKGKEIAIGDEILAATVTMEAEHDIQYAKKGDGSSYKTPITAKGDVLLNAKKGMVGAKELPIYVDTKGHFYVGAKSVAYLDGNSADGYPHVYPSNPPPRLIFQGAEMQYLLVEDLNAAEERLLSLTPDLLHTIPGGFIHNFMVTPRRAPIYFRR
jgi:filamentous hemagglutinin family protein